jgi:RND family efflux transporter MFP subunit
MVENNESQPSQLPPASSKAVAAVALLLVLVAAAGTATLFFRQRAAQAREVEQIAGDLARGPVVRVAQVKLAATDRVVTLPAEVRADQRTTLYAKVSGYLKEVRVDKGDRVKAGQVLAVLESPDLDEQVRSAEAELVLRKQQLARTERLFPSGRVSMQDRETAQEGVKVATAALNRAKVQKDYEVIRAPFAGTVTARYADPGALLPAATGSTSSAQPVVDLAQLDKLRVALNLAQDDASRVSVGDAVKLDISPDQPPLAARISRVSHALDARTRTMLCEIDLANPPQGLYPGAFVNASISLHGAPHPLIPTEALVGKGGQLYAPLVSDQKVHFKPVRLGVDDGHEVEVLEGLHGGEWVALNLGTEVPDGATVRTQAR